MRKPSKTWLECIKVKIYILLLFITCPSLVGAQSDIDQSRSAARSAAGSAYQYLGSGAAINQNAGQPIMSDKPMTTLDGSQSGNVQMSCPSTTKFVDILIQPGATGDLTTVMVSQDTKLNGQINYQFNMPFPVSGICGNGVIQCNPGTWNNCVFWAWTANTQGQLSIQQTDYTRMGGCYCINNSCGNNIAWTNLSLILKDLGGGATGAIMSANPQYSITSTSISDTEIAYYSQALTSCGSGNQGATNPASYFAGGQTDTLVTNAAQTEVATEQTDPNSLYSVMNNAIQYHADLVQEIQCKIIRGISIAESATCPYGNAALNATRTTCTDQGDNCASYCDTLSGCQVALTPITVSGSWNRMIMYSMWGSGSNVVGSGSEVGSLYYYYDYSYNQGLSENFITIPGENITGNVTTYPNYIADIWGSGENLEPVICYNSNLADPLYNANTGGLVVATNPDDIVCQPAGEINIPGVTMTTDVASPITPCLADYWWDYSYEYYSYSNGYCVYPLLFVETSGNTITSSFYGTHLLLGNRASGLNDPDRYATSMVGVILGDGSSSRLYKSVREKDGLAYSIYSYGSAYGDSGILGIYSCTAVKDIPKSEERILSTIYDFVENGPTKEEVTRAKAQLKAGVVFSLENLWDRASLFARDELYYKERSNVSESLASIEKVTDADIAEAAKKYLTKERLTSLKILPKQSKVERRSRSHERKD